MKYIIFCKYRVRKLYNEYNINIHVTLVHIYYYITIPQFLSFFQYHLKMVVFEMLLLEMKSLYI